MSSQKKLRSIDIKLLDDLFEMGGGLRLSAIGRSHLGNPG